MVEAMCDEYVKIGFPEGAVELALAKYRALMHGTRPRLFSVDVKTQTQKTITSH